MMIELNKVFLVGRLCADPELRHTKDNKPVCGMRLAINQRGRQGSEPEPIFIGATAWGKTAEFCDQYLSKGKAVMVEGRLRMESWTDKETGKKRDRITVVADRVQFAEPKGAESGGDRNDAEEMPF